MGSELVLANGASSLLRFERQVLAGGTTWMPLSTASARLMEQPRTVEFLNGVDAIARSSGASDVLRGVSLALDPPGYFRAFSMALPNMGRAHVATHAISSGAHFSPLNGYVQLGPQTTQPLFLHLHGAAIDPATGWQMANTVRHEIEHAVTPAFGEYQRTRWLEEGLVTLLTESRDEVNQSARLLGLPSRRPPHDPAATSVYQHETSSLRTLLAMAGLNPDTAAGLQQTRVLLQEPRSLREVATRLAARIGERIGRADPISRDRMADQLLAHSGRVDDTRALIAQWMDPAHELPPLTRPAAASARPAA